MNIKEVLDYYGGITHAAKALGISYQAVQQWVAKDHVPEGRQWQLQAITAGKLQADRRDA